MSEYRSTLERELERLSPPRIPFDQLQRRRDRKRRDQRIRAGVLGLAVAIVMGWLGLNAIRSTPSIPAVDPTPTPIEDPHLVTPTPSPARGTSLTLDKPGLYFLDVLTGEATRLPKSVTDVAQAAYDEAGYQPSPEGSRLLFVGTPDGSRASQVFVANIDGTEMRQVTDDPDGSSWASWSPDGSTIVFVEPGANDTNDSTFGSQLMLLDVATGEVTVLAGGDDRTFQYPRFSPDGSTILFTRESANASYYPPLSLWTIAIDGGEPDLLVENGYDAVYSPDGTTIAFHRGVDVCLLMCHGGTTESQIWLADVDGSNVRPFGGVGTWAPRWSPDGSRIAFARAIRDEETVDGDAVGSTGPGSGSGVSGVVVLDPGTGAFTTIVEASTPYAWLDDHTLIVG